MASKHRVTVGEELRYDSDFSGLRNLNGTYARLTGLAANARRILGQLQPADYDAFAASADAPTVTVGGTATITARVAGPQSGEVTEVGYRGTWDSTFGRLPMGGGTTVSGLDFIHTGTAVEVHIMSGVTGTLPVWVLVNGQPATATQDTTSVGAVTTGSEYFIKLTFGSSKRRRIEFFCPAAGYWYGVAVGLTDGLEPAPRKPVVAWVSDSFWGGSAGSGILQTSAMLASRMLGVECFDYSQGGTGYVTAGSFQTFGDAARVSTVASASPDLIVFQGSINDDVAAGVQAAATSSFAAYRAACPNAPLIVLGPQPTTATGTLGANRQTNIAAVKAAAVATGGVIGFHDMVGTAAGVPAAYGTFQTYPDGTLVTRYGSVWKVNNGGVAYATGPYGPPNDTRYALKTWGYYGTGQIGGTAGDGTRDTYLHSDGIHPTAAAQKALADVTAARIRADLTAYAASAAVTVD